LLELMNLSLRMKQDDRLLVDNFSFTLQRGDSDSSDGVAYKIKKAINVLKGYKESDETDGSDN